MQLSKENANRKSFGYKNLTTKILRCLVKRIMFMRICFHKPKYFELSSVSNY